jgi:hypothetical protein
MRDGVDRAAAPVHRPPAVAVLLAGAGGHLGGAPRGARLRPPPAPRTPGDTFRGVAGATTIALGARQAVLAMRTG